MVKEVETPPGIRFGGTTNRKIADGAEAPNGGHQSIHDKSPQLVSAFHENQLLGREGKHIDFIEEQSATAQWWEEISTLPPRRGVAPKGVTIVDTSTEAGLGFPHSFLHPHVVTKEGWREAEVAPDADHQSPPKSRLSEESE